MLLPLLPLLLLPTSLALFTRTTTNDEALKVPGENPLYFCEDPVAAEHILQISNVELDPNPPRAGETLRITASGNFTKVVEDGAYVNLVVKIGLITLVRRTEDLCERMKDIDKECPLQEGETSISKEVDLPSYIPPGKFVVTADAYSVDDEILTCLKAEASFSRPSIANAEQKKNAGNGQAVIDKESIDL